jgi:hypothetical protein
VTSEEHADKALEVELMELMTQYPEATKLVARSRGWKG